MVSDHGRVYLFQILVLVPRYHFNVAKLFLEHPFQILFSQFTPQPSWQWHQAAIFSVINYNFCLPKWGKTENSKIVCASIS